MTLLERLDRLERSNRRWRAVALGAALACGLAMLGGAKDRPEVLTVERLRVVAPDGREIATLGTEETGPQLRLLDKLGRPRAILNVVDAIESPALILDGEPTFRVRRNPKAVGKSEACIVATARGGAVYVTSPLSGTKALDPARQLDPPFPAPADR